MISIQSVAFLTHGQHNTGDPGMNHLWQTWWTGHWRAANTLAEQDAEAKDHGRLFTACFSMRQGHGTLLASMFVSQWMM